MIFVWYWCFCIFYNTNRGWGCCFQAWNPILCDYHFICFRKNGPCYGGTELYIILIFTAQHFCVIQLTTSTHAIFCTTRYEIWVQSGLREHLVIYLEEYKSIDNVAGVSFIKSDYLNKHQFYSMYLQLHVHETTGGNSSIHQHQRQFR